MHKDDISDDGGYYSGIVFVPSVSKTYFLNERITTAADTACCDGVGPQSKGTTFEVVTYDTNINLLQLSFAHFIGAECQEYLEGSISSLQKSRRVRCAEANYSGKSKEEHCFCLS